MSVLLASLVVVLWACQTAVLLFQPEPFGMLFLNLLWLLLDLAALLLTVKWLWRAFALQESRSGVIAGLFFAYIAVVLFTNLRFRSSLIVWSIFNETDAKQRLAGGHSDDHEVRWDNIDGKSRIACSFGGLLDNWSGMVYDPTGRVSEVNRSAPFWKHHRVEMSDAFGGDLVYADHIWGSWYWCTFT